jgi:hypothetical protein
MMVGIHAEAMARLVEIYPTVEYGNVGSLAALPRRIALVSENGMRPGRAEDIVIRLVCAVLGWSRARDREGARLVNDRAAVCPGPAFIVREQLQRVGLPQDDARDAGAVPSGRIDACRWAPGIHARRRREERVRPVAVDGSDDRVRHDARRPSGREKCGVMVWIGPEALPRLVEVYSAVEDGNVGSLAPLTRRVALVSEDGMRPGRPEDIVIRLVRAVVGWSCVWYRYTGWTRLDRATDHPGSAFIVGKQFHDERMLSK